MSVMGAYIYGHVVPLIVHRVSAEGWRERPNSRRLLHNPTSTYLQNEHTQSGDQSPFEHGAAVLPQLQDTGYAQFQPLYSTHTAPQSRPLTFEPTQFNPMIIGLKLITPVSSGRDVVATGSTFLRLSTAWARFAGHSLDSD